MADKTFVHYLPDGEIAAVTTEDEVYLQERLARGEPIVVTDAPVTFGYYKVDMSTMTVVPKDNQELAQVGLQQIDYQPPWQTN